MTTLADIKAPAPTRTWNGTIINRPSYAEIAPFVLDELNLDATDANLALATRWLQRVDISRALYPVDVQCPNSGCSLSWTPGDRGTGTAADVIVSTCQWALSQVPGTIVAEDPRGLLAENRKGQAGR